jgi:hypothetical protein
MYERGSSRLIDRYRELVKQQNFASWMNRRIDQMMLEKKRFAL